MPSWSWALLSPKKFVPTGRYGHYFRSCLASLPMFLYQSPSGRNHPKHPAVGSRPVWAAGLVTGLHHPAVGHGTENQQR